MIKGDFTIGKGIPNYGTHMNSITEPLVNLFNILDRPSYYEDT